MRNILTIAANTFKEAIRQKLMLLVAIIAVALVFSSNYFLRLDLGHEQLRFVFDFGSGALGFFGSIIAIVAVCQLFHSEIENKTVITLLSKPVGVSGFVLGKFFGAVFALALFTAVICAATAAVLAFTRESFAARGFAGIPDVNYAGLCVYAALQWCKLCAIAAVTALVCSVSTSLLFSVVVSFMALSVSIMAEATLGLGGELTNFTRTAAAIFPDLGIFNASEAFAFAPVNIMAALAAAAYAAVYAATSCALASWLFSRREF